MRCMELAGYRELWRRRGVMALLASSLLARLPSFGVRYVWVLAAVLAAMSLVLSVRVPPQRQPEPALAAGSLLGESA